MWIYPWISTENLWIWIWMANFSRERATVQTSESKRAKFKTAHDFSRATACNASRILAIVEASVLLCVSVAMSGCLSIVYNPRLYQNAASYQIFKFLLSATTNLSRVSGSQKRCKIGQGLLISYIKSHKSFRLTPKSATLNNLETQNRSL